MSICFCDARQGGGAYGKTPAARPSSCSCSCSCSCSWPFAHMFLLALSPDSVDNRITVFE
ncbi:hypothetical protein A3T36_24310 [Salmonella enterica subsp. enterica serovar Typhimurium]|uniref:hypothetical protein n=1 Tax=Escherichia coli TaxID=562 RepID=UPI00128249EA|nr:hypothetical protein [Escherichia coli]EBV4125474.1 hypothetical protein [Salmonella enterica subsp. enterica serovar Typhimurium]ECG5621911.1 hypothetical protein [Salmonella enterica subsp. enterica serovar Typhimurium]ECN4477765.1 hypothetical protein [Salmonella enterica subsp. enterica serovar Typhimurium]ECN6218113.1 hypothetical protein [Salmonella enterica subsp. enterica serovar Typhimurium]ECY4628704.1 hypothetical protein [Salmonella enterica subsp. enterica serovar Typhimurium]